jgi:hypothetical protein
MSAKEAAPNRCAVNDCRLPRQPGEYLCIEHKPKPPSLRESIASGPRFMPAKPDGPKCIACGGASAQTEPGAEVDAATGLGPNCWRAWRFSTERKS